MKKGWRRKTLIGAGVLLVLAGLLVALAPTLASTGFVRNRVAAWLSSELGATVGIEELDLGWSGPLAIRGLTIHASEGEFAGDELARIQEAQVDAGLWRLWRGPDSIATQVSGLRVTVDERGGGRTNLDPLLRRFLPARKPTLDPTRPAEPTVAATPLKLPPIDITLTDCALRVRRLPYSPPEERINPFKQDVPVRAADEGYDLYQLTAAHVGIGIDGEQIDARVGGSLKHGSDTTKFQADIHVRDGVPQGTLDVDQFDLALMDPFVAGKLSGRITARAEGRFEDGMLSATLAVDVEDLVTDRLREEWIRARVHVNQKPTLYAVHPIELTSASGRFAAQGGIDIPIDEPYRPSGELAGTLPLAMTYRAFAHREPPIEAQVRFNLKSQLHHEGGHAAGMVYLDHFTAREKLGEVTLAFDLIGDRARKNLRIDKLNLRSAIADVTVHGKLHHGQDWTLDLGGEVDADLARLHELAGHFMQLPPSFHVQGRTGIQVHGVTRTKEGVVRLVADVKSVGLKTRGVAPTQLAYPDMTAHLDASLLDGGDRIIVNQASLEGVRIMGMARGLMDPGAPPEISGTALGQFPLSEQLVRFLGADNIRNLSGGANVDLRLRSAGGNASLEGTVGIDGLGFQVGDYDHGDRDFEWTGTVHWRDQKIGGAFTAHGPRARLEVLELSADPRAGTARAKAKLDVHNVETLRDLLLLDSKIDWTGRHEVEVDVAADRESLQIAASIHAPRLRFLIDGYGISGDDTQADARVEYRNGAWFIRETTLAVPARNLRASTKELEIRDGGVSGDITVAGRFEKLHSLVEALREVDVRGDFQASSSLRIDGDVEGSLRFDSPAFAIGSEKLGHVTLQVPRARVSSNIEIPQYSLIVGEDLEAKGALTLDRDLKLNIEAKGNDVGWVMHFIDGFDGRGAFGLTADVRAPHLELDGDYTVSGSAHVEHIEAANDRVFDGVRMEVKGVRFRADGGNLHDITTDTKIHARQVRRHRVTAKNVTAHSTGSGSILADGSGPGYRTHIVTGADSIQIEKRTLNGLELDGWGTLKSLDLEEAMAVQFDGKLKFERIPAAVLDWTNGESEFSFRSHVFEIKNLRTTIQGGQLTGSARFDFREPVVPWSVKIRTVDAKLDADFADPLSYIIPVLRVAGDPNAEVSGFASWDIDLRGIGFKFDDLEKHLTGSGNLRLRDARVKGSLLLPLLSLRVGRLLLNKPFVIPNSTALWSVENGVVTTQPLKISGQPFGIRMGGTVTLRGHLDYIFHPGVLLVPISVKGEWKNIKVRPTTRELIPKWPFK